MWIIECKAMKKLPVISGFTQGNLVLKDEIVIQDVTFNGLGFFDNLGNVVKFDEDQFDYFTYTDTNKRLRRSSLLPALKLLDQNDIVAVIHGGCPDGLASAAVIMDALGPNINIVGGRYSKSIYDSVASLHGKTVILADFSYNETEMLKIISEAKQVIFLDHHKSSLIDLNTVLAHPKVYCHADANYSGASLTWDFFHPHEQVPLFIQYIEDGDLYKFNLPDAKDIITGLHVVMGDNLEVITPLLSDTEFSTKLVEFRTIGMSINKNASRNANKLIKNGMVQACTGGFTFPLLNATPDHTNLIGELVGALEHVPFVMIYTILSDKVKISLRSGKHGVDVTQAIKELNINGGGHKHAGAGFMSLKDFMDTVLSKTGPFTLDLNIQVKTCCCCS